MGKFVSCVHCPECHRSGKIALRGARITGGGFTAPDVIMGPNAEVLDGGITIAGMPRDWLFGVDGAELGCVKIVHQDYAGFPLFLRCIF